MLETQKLELLTEISSLKLKLTTADRENKNSEVTVCNHCIISFKNHQPEKFFFSTSIFIL